MACPKSPQANGGHGQGLHLTGLTPSPNSMSSQPALGCQEELKCPNSIHAEESDKLPSFLGHQPCLFL